MKLDDSFQQIHQPHDKAFKFLLASKKVFIQLLRSFVDRGWVEHVDEVHLERVDKSYIAQDFRGREADMVYRMEFKGHEVIFYVLLEMQSSVDYQMPYRLLLYEVEIWRDILKNYEQGDAERKDFRLPPIVPIVLYNGKSPWTASRRFRGNVAYEEWFGNELLDFEYILIDINRIGEEELLQLSNFVGAVFLLEQRTDAREFVDGMTTLAGVLEQLSDEEFTQFIAWVRLTMRSMSGEHRAAVEKILEEANPEEVIHMISNLEKVFEEHESKTLEKGFLRGKALGMEEGKEEVARNMLIDGFDLTQIAKVTGLSREKLDRLQ